LWPAQPPKLTSPLSVTGRFTSSQWEKNKFCPVISHKIIGDTQADAFRFIKGEKDDNFNLTMTAIGAEVSADYQYTVEATAEGGAKGSVAGTMVVKPQCIAAKVADYVLSETRNIPEFGTSPSVIIAASTNYIAEPPITKKLPYMLATWPKRNHGATYECEQTFELAD
jgi:hypothetical protein